MSAALQRVSAAARHGRMLMMAGLGLRFAVVLGLLVGLCWLTAPVDGPPVTLLAVLAWCGLMAAAWEISRRHR